jgi:Kdo2-lipid IVA lauroyltransferase/acyltransferase
LKGLNLSRFSGVFNHLGVLLMRMLAPLPLPLLRGLGFVLGHVLYVLAVPRRRVVWVNLSLCFPSLSVAQRRRLARQAMVRFTQAWLDRSWLWHGSATQLRRRLSLSGAVNTLRQEPRLVLFVPHFVGLDAGVMAVCSAQIRPLCSIYARQRNPIVNQWIMSGRLRFGQMRLFQRHEGTREIAQAIEQGQALYLLPDMDFGSKGATFAPFMGVPAATVTSLSRFARLSKARVATLLNRMTTRGYEVHVSDAWPDFPTSDAVQDTMHMNQMLQALVEQTPEQYYWVHKRFKTRPPGEKSPYGAS